MLPFGSKVIDEPVRKNPSLPAAQPGLKPDPGTVELPGLVLNGPRMFKVPKLSTKMAPPNPAPPPPAPMIAGLGSPAPPPTPPTATNSLGL